MAELEQQQGLRRVGAPYAELLELHLDELQASPVKPLGERNQFQEILVQSRAPLRFMIHGGIRFPGHVRLPVVLILLLPSSRNPSPDIFILEQIACLPQGIGQGG